MAGLSFSLPATAWTDSSTPVDLLTTDLQDTDVTWTLEKDEYSCSQSIKIYPVVGLTVDVGEMSHTNTAEDVTLTTENLGSNKVVWAAVYPIPTVAWTMPNYAHTDSTFAVAVESENVVEDASIKWHIDDTYGLRQDWRTYVASTLFAILHEFVLGQQRQRYGFPKVLL